MRPSQLAAKGVPNSIKNKVDALHTRDDNDDTTKIIYQSSLFTSCHSGGYMLLTKKVKKSIR